jgi:hypothetical protein
MTEKTVEEKCLGCNNGKQKMTVVADTEGEILSGHYQVLKCGKGHLEVKHEDGQLVPYSPHRTDYF